MIIQEIIFESSMLTEEDFTVSTPDPELKGKKYPYNKNWRNKKARKYPLRRK